MGLIRPGISQKRGLMTYTNVGGWLWPGRQDRGGECVRIPPNRFTIIMLVEGGRETARWMVFEVFMGF
jgi:hypothetical protein